PRACSGHVETLLQVDARPPGRASTSSLRNKRIGVGKDKCLPALRTGRAVFPHTALQSMVSSLGVSRVLPGRMKCEQPSFCEECIRPLAMVAVRLTEAGPLRLLAQDRTQPSSRELVDDGK